MSVAPLGAAAHQLPCTSGRAAGGGSGHGRASSRTRGSVSAVLSSGLRRVDWQPSYQPPRTVVFVVNPSAGRGKGKRRWLELRQDAMDALAGVEMREVYTDGVGDATRLTRQALLDGADCVVAVGGDGTISEVVNGFFQEDAESPVSSRRPAIGVLPVGTGSDFVRTFDFRGNTPLDALERLRRGRRRPLDIGRITMAGMHPRLFCNVCSMGLSAEVVRGVSSLKWLSKLSYAVAVPPAFRRYSAPPVLLRIDDGRPRDYVPMLERLYTTDAASRAAAARGGAARDADEWRRVDRLTALAVGNGRCFGGGMIITPGADPSDGLLEAVTLDGFSVLDFALKGYKLFQGTHVMLPNVSVDAARVLQVRLADDCAPGASLPIEADGELVATLRAEDGPLTLTTMPHALELLV